MIKDYSNSFNNCAIYLPAISRSYALAAISGQFKRVLPFSAQDLNFFDLNSRLFYYPWALYSAGQAVRSLNSGDPPTMANRRDRSKTIVLGDSGGFQIQNGTIKFQGEATVTKMLQWMEVNADYSMVLDFPTGGIKSGEMAKHRERLNSEGHAQSIGNLSNANGQATDFNAALVQTTINNQIFVNKRTPIATKILNVVQGRTEAESKAWYEHVKHSPFEGWAFAGNHKYSLSITLQRLIDLRDDGLLATTPWLHILGISKLEMACIYTVIQRVVRETVNPHFQISFDSATPFKLAANYALASGLLLSERGWSQQNVRLSDKSLAGSADNLADYLDSGERIIKTSHTKHSNVAHTDQPVDTLVSQVMKVGDIRIENGNGAPWDNAGLFLAMNHNVQAMLEAMRYAHSTFFNPNNEMKIPLRIRMIRDLIPMVFKSAQPDKFIKECADVLDTYAA